MIEKSNGEGLQPATDSAFRPGNFILCSRKSRAAARALLERRKRPNHPPGFTLDLSSQSFERCQEIYARIASLHHRGPIPTGPYMEIRFPDGFIPTDPANTDPNQNRSESGDLQ
jgi:hypothetical protein